MGKLVCVTGASGFIASWIIKILLERGYTVRGTYRQPGYDLKTKHLRALEGAEERLTFVEADLLVEGSFDAAVAGCDGVFHTASPCYRRVKDPQAELIDPAVKGTLNVLGSCTKEKTVKKVVLTSSLATVRYTGRSLTPDVVVDETWWSDQDHCRQKEMWNALSKILAEDAAWEFLKEKHMDMVTINPGTVIGPFLQATPNSSSVVIRYLLRGMETYPNATLCLVNVKDVAMAHILAFENPCASGRYCMGESVVHFSEVVEIMHDLYPDLKLPTKCENDKPFEPKYQISKAKVTTLGIEYIPLKESIKGTVVSLEKFEQWMMAEKRRDEELLKRKEVVCVTGASGFIASWIIKLLLERGYTVRGTYRKPDVYLKTKHLYELQGAEERFTLVEADLLVEGSFDAAVAGCDCVFHTASPFHHSVEDPQAELIDPAVKGTLNVLGSCAKEQTVKRVVLTSSFAAVGYNGRPLTPNVVVDETWWSDPDHCRRKKMWNSVSKTLAEDAAWKFVKEKHMDMVTINPGLVIGRFLQTTPNGSSDIISNLMKCTEICPNTTMGWVNVKDVAMAHILAFENPQASGRYCVVESVAHYSKVVEILLELCPDLKLPTKIKDGEAFVPTYQISKERTRTLGIEYIPLKESIKGTVESLKKFEQWTMAEKRRDDELKIWLEGEEMNLLWSADALACATVLGTRNL